jgi:hypothetical protein
MAGICGGKSHARLSQCARGVSGVMDGWIETKRRRQQLGEETRDSERMRLSERELDEVDESMVSTAVEKARLVLCEARVP